MSSVLPFRDVSIEVTVSEHQLQAGFTMSVRYPVSHVLYVAAKLASIGPDPSVFIIFWVVILSSTVWYAL